MLTVKSLVSTDHVETATICLQSLSKCSPSPINIRIYGDGSLTKADISVLEKSIDGGTVCPEENRREAVLSWLSKYENCLWMRQNNNFSMKLFDVAAMSDNHINFCDSDILFVRGFRDVFDHSESAGVFTTSGTLRNGYSFPPTSLSPLGGVGLVDSLNSGLFSFQKRFFDLEYLDWIIGKMKEVGGFNRRSTWTEQTCWSALAHRSNCQLFSFDSITIPRESVWGGRVSLRVDLDEVIAIHFVSPVRHHLNSFAILEPDSRKKPHTYQPKENNFIRQLISDVKFSLEQKRKQLLR